MASFKTLYAFLEQLSQNNSKEWMDANRKAYNEHKAFFTQWLKGLSGQLEGVDPDYTAPAGNKPKVFRINNNRRFHPNKPTYKDHFAGELDASPKKCFFYMHFGLKETFIAGGLYHALPETIAKIRDAIDYNGHELRAIVQHGDFAQMFGAFKDDEALKNAPKGYAKDHEHIDLLRFNNFVASYTPTRKEVYGANFAQKVVQVYQTMLPFRQYLNQALQFNEQED